MTTEDQLISQIKALPGYVLHIRRAAGGLGSVVIYQPIPRGFRTESIWLGREYSVPMLQEFLATRVGGAA